MCVPAAGLASRHAADPHSFHVAADAWHGHPQPWPGCRARLPHGSPRVRQPTGVWLEVSRLQQHSVSTFESGSLFLCSIVINIIILIIKNIQSNNKNTILDLILIPVMTVIIIISHFYRAGKIMKNECTLTRLLMSLNKLKKKAEPIKYI